MSRILPYSGLSRDRDAEDLEEEEESEEEDGFPSRIKSFLALICGPRMLCCCCLLILSVGTEVVAWTRQASCDAEAQMAQNVSWGSTIPNKTMSQMQTGLTNLLWHQVNVYNEQVSNTSTVGYWSDVNLLQGMIEKYAYVTQTDGKEETILEAWKPWGFYLGQRYNIFRCANSDHEYVIEEDYWAKPWFNFNGQQIFNIKQSSTGQIVAKSQHKLANAFSFNAYWVATVETPSGELIATVHQDPPYSAGWFQYPKWHALNVKPDILPNEVVSFMASVYDIEREGRKGKGR